MLTPPITPLGLAYVAMSVREDGHDVHVLDLNLSEDIKADIPKTILEFSPDVIGISIRNIDNVTMLHSAFFIPRVKEVVKHCQNASDAPIVLGGPGFSMMPREIMHEVGADYGVIGEGEVAFVELLDCLQKEEIPYDIPGVIFRDNGKLHRSSPRNMSSEKLDQLPPPARDLLDNLKYLNDGGMGNIQTKRGCDQKCIYCTYPVIEGRILRFRSPKKIVDEIEILLEMGIDYLHFSDSTFNIPNEHAFNICNEMKRRNISIQYTPYMSPYSPSREIFTLLKETGCDGITFGTDIISEKMLLNMQKGFTVADIFKSSDLCKELDIPFSMNLLFGGPGETKETVMESLHNIDKMKPVAVGAMMGIRCFPQTPLWNIACKEGLISKDTNILEPFYYVSPTIDKNWMIDTIKEYNEQHDNFFIPSRKGIHTDELVIQIFRDGFRGPFWEVYRELMRRLELQRDQ